MAGPLAAQRAGATGAPRGGRFSRFANATARLSGRPATFILATLTIVIWAASGPYFKYSDTWQLVINTGTTIVTFLMVFLIQNTQNRDTLALQLKLDELILANKNASNAIVAVEEEPDEKLEELKQREKQKAHATPSR